MHLFTNVLQKHCFIFAQVFKKIIFVPKHFLKATSAWVVYSNIHVITNKETVNCVSIRDLKYKCLKAISHDQNKGSHSENQGL